MSRRFTKTLLLLVLVTLGAACKSHGVRESLDARTLVSIIVSDPNLVFYRDAHSGGFGRDFVSLGPVELVGSNQRGYYLWLCVWGTLPGGDYRYMRQPDTVNIDTGEQTFQLRRTTSDFADLNVSQPIYAAPVLGGDAGYFAVSPAQLEAMAQAAAITIGIGEHRFEIWTERPEATDAFRQFVDEVISY